MKLTIEFSDEDIQIVRALVASQSKRVFVLQRIQRNVDGEMPSINRETAWLTIMMCLLSTQQRSNPSSPISRLLLCRPFPLSLQACASAKEVEAFTRSVIEDFGGIRFAPKISGQVRNNLVRLESGGWNKLEKHLAVLTGIRKRSPQPEDYPQERKAAREIQGINGGLEGFGPKQSRNFWQSLGLMRNEFILDSRVLKFLRKLDFPIPLSSMALGEEDYYCFISDQLRELCLRAGILPCILDAAIFSSFDQEEWPEDAAVW